MGAIAGIIAEYNPFHTGHRYHLQMTRALLQAAVGKLAAGTLAGASAGTLAGADDRQPLVIVAMSGHFTQRGEPAVLDKWTRAAAAVRGGADLVVELPTVYSVADAGTFARGGVALLEGLGVRHISFGSETGDTAALVALADKLEQHREKMEAAMAAGVREGLSWPRARQTAAESFLTAEELAVLRQPNDILALEYIRAMKTARPLAVERAGVGHLTDGPAGGFAPATWLRQQCRLGRDIGLWLPEPLPVGPVSWNAAAGQDMAAEDHPAAGDASWLAPRLEAAERNLFLLVAAKALTLPAAVLEDAPAGGEGLGYKLQEAVRHAGDLESLLDGLKSKRYTHARLRRYLTQMLLDIRRQDPEAVPMPPYARLLALNRRGAAYLKALKRSETCPFPILTNVNKERELLSPAARACLETDMRATDLFHLLRGEALDRDADVQRPAMFLDRDGEGQPPEKTR